MLSQHVVENVALHELALQEQHCESNGMLSHRFDSLMSVQEIPSLSPLQLEPDQEHPVMFWQFAWFEMIEHDGFPQKSMNAGSLQFVPFHSQKNVSKQPFWLPSKSEQPSSPPIGSQSESPADHVHSNP